MGLTGVFAVLMGAIVVVYAAGAVHTSRKSKAMVRKMKQ